VVCNVYFSLVSLLSIENESVPKSPTFYTAIVGSKPKKTTTIKDNARK
jgi:hypothetical protein